MRGNSRLPSGTCTRPISTRRRGDTVSMRCPSNRTSPRRQRHQAGNRPQAGVLPAPLAPISVTDSAASTAAKRRAARGRCRSHRDVAQFKQHRLGHAQIGLDHLRVGGDSRRASHRRSGGRTAARVMRSQTFITARMLCSTRTTVMPCTSRRLCDQRPSCGRRPRGSCLPPARPAAAAAASAPGRSATCRSRL